MRTAGQVVDCQGLAHRLGAIDLDSGVVLLALEWGPPTGVIALNWSWTLETELKVAQISALLVDPENEDAITDGLRRLIEDTDMAEELRHAGLARAAEYSWQRTIDTLILSWRQALP